MTRRVFIVQISKKVGQSDRCLPACPWKNYRRVLTVSLRRYHFFISSFLFLPFLPALHATVTCHTSCITSAVPVETHCRASMNISSYLLQVYDTTPSLHVVHNDCDESQNDLQRRGGRDNTDPYECNLTVRLMRSPAFRATCIRERVTCTEPPRIMITFR